MYLKGIKELFEDKTMHIEKSRGDYQSNYDYCSKEGNWFELGVPKTGGKCI